MITGDDLEVGLVFTVLNDHREAGRTRYAKGKPYKITALNLPFIGYEFKSKTSCLPDILYGTLDFREVDLIKLNPTYIAQCEKE